MTAQFHERLRLHVAATVTAITLCGATALTPALAQNPAPAPAAGAASQQAPLSKAQLEQLVAPIAL